MIRLLARAAIVYPFLQVRKGVLRRFRRQLEQCRLVQQQALERKLQLCANSRMGRDLDLRRIRNLDDLRRLPIGTYESLQPYIDQVRQGDQTAMFAPGTRLVMFALTSGTTAATKYIPVTAQSLAEFRYGADVWGVAVVGQHPWMPAVKVINLASGWRSSRTPAGIPCGSISGLAARAVQNSIQSISGLSPLAASVEEDQLRRYLSLRLSLRFRQVRMVLTPNPSTLLSFARDMDHHKEILVRDLHDGSLHQADRYDPQLRARLRWSLGLPRKTRARELDRVMQRNGRLFPKDAWPELELLGLWTGGTLSYYLPQLGQYYGSTALRELGLIATEGRMTLPLEDGRPDGPLDVAGSVYEFIPQEERDASHPTVLWPHELQVGKSYYILLTTSGGLFRYDIQDVVECTGFMGATPMLRFLHKGSQFASITGEKISAYQVARAVEQVQAQMQVYLGEFCLAPRWGDPPGYEILVETQHLPASPELAQRIWDAIDQALCQANMEYQSKRQSGRLAPVQCRTIATGTFERRRQEQLSLRGASVEQYKHPCLSNQMDFGNTLAAQADTSSRRK